MEAAASTTLPAEALREPPAAAQELRVRLTPRARQARRAQQVQRGVVRARAAQQVQRAPAALAA